MSKTTKSKNKNEKIIEMMRPDHIIVEVDEKDLVKFLKKRWVVLLDYKDLGLDIEDIKIWIDTGLSAEEVKKWLDAGWDFPKGSPSAVEFIESGARFLDPNVLLDLYNTGRYTTEEIVKLVEEGYILSDKGKIVKITKGGN